MVQNKKEKPSRLLTDVELELMNIVWKLGECTVKEVQESLPCERDLAYTSVATIMKILEQKKFLSSRKGDRAHTYAPAVSRKTYEAATLKHVAKHVFAGDSSSMVMRLLDDSDLSKEELESIRRLLNERLGSR